MNDLGPYDLLIAGGGNAAMCAAIEAAESGAKVIIATKKTSKANTKVKKAVKQPNETKEKSKRKKEKRWDIHRASY